LIDNEWELEQVYVSFQPRIHRYLTRLVGAKEAEDLTQEVFIKVGKALATFRSESQLSTWIYRIATNVAVDRMRSPSVRRESVSGQPGYNYIAEDNAEKEVIAAQASSLENQVIHKEMNDCIRGIVESLPENYRIVVVLSELEGMSDKEIAGILEVNLPVVKVRLYRGKARLKKELLNHCSFSWDERNEFACDPKGNLVKKTF
jgi:RNA polymerase sigma-70 factor (ECF subfamily)